MSKPQQSTAVIKDISSPLYKLSAPAAKQANVKYVSSIDALKRIPLKNNSAQETRDAKLNIPRKKRPAPKSRIPLPTSAKKIKALPSHEDSWQCPTSDSDVNTQDVAPSRSYPDINYIELVALDYSSFKIISAFLDDQPMKKVKSEIHGLVGNALYRQSVTVETPSTHSLTHIRLKIARIVQLLFKIQSISSTEVQIEKQVPLWEELYGLFILKAIPSHFHSTVEFAKLFTLVKSKFVCLKMLFEEDPDLSIRMVTDYSSAIQSLDLPETARLNISIESCKIKSLFKPFTDESADFSGIVNVKEMNSDSIINSFKDFMREIVSYVDKTCPPLIWNHNSTVISSSSHETAVTLTIKETEVDAETVAECIGAVEADMHLTCTEEDKENRFPELQVSADTEHRDNFLPSIKSNDSRETEYVLNDISVPLCNMNAIPESLPKNTDSFDESALKLPVTNVNENSESLSTNTDNFVDKNVALNVENPAVVDTVFEDLEMSEEQIATQDGGNGSGPLDLCGQNSNDITEEQDQLHANGNHVNECNVKEVEGNGSTLINHSVREEFDVEDEGVIVVCENDDLDVEDIDDVLLPIQENVTSVQTASEDHLIEDMCKLEADSYGLNGKLNVAFKLGQFIYGLQKSLLNTSETDKGRMDIDILDADLPTGFTNGDSDQLQKKKSSGKRLAKQLRKEQHKFNLAIDDPLQRVVQSLEPSRHVNPFRLHAQAPTTLVDSEGREYTEVFVKSIIPGRSLFTLHTKYTRKRVYKEKDNLKGSFCNDEESNGKNEENESTNDENEEKKHAARQASIRRAEEATRRRRNRIGLLRFSQGNGRSISDIIEKGSSANTFNDRFLEDLEQHNENSNQDTHHSDVRLPIRREKWTQAEDEALEDGLIMLGHQWAAIRMMHIDKLGKRTNVSLKDRARTLKWI